MKGKRWFRLLSIGLVLVLLTSMAGFSLAQEPATTPVGTAASAPLSTSFTY